MKIVTPPTFPAAVSDTASVLALQAEVERLREELASVRAEMSKRLMDAPALPSLVIPDVAPEPSFVPEPIAAVAVVRERVTDPFFAQLWAYVSRPTA